MIKMGTANEEVVEKVIRKVRMGEYSYPQAAAVLKSKGIVKTVQELKETANNL